MIENENSLSFLQNIKNKRALVSVSDKTGLIEFLKPLVDLGLQIISTGGTFEFLKNNKIAVQDISSVTHFPEVLNGRVKTLHPNVHMGLLADQNNPEHMHQLDQQSVEPFHMVIGNLYPFEQVALNNGSSFSDLIENIDIGGPSFLRASAKNFSSIVVLSDPNDYYWVLTKILSKDLNLEDRKLLALKVFSLTSYYDALIVQKLVENISIEKTDFQLPYYNIPLKLKSSLRYGENAQQKANWFENPLEESFFKEMTLHQGKELSYNNLLDLDVAFDLVSQFEKPACVAVKHNNPCAVAYADSLVHAGEKVLISDSKSIFGGIVSFNQVVDIQTCLIFKNIFLECIIAPSFTEESLEFLKNKKNLRIISVKPEFIQNLNDNSGHFQFNCKSISGGVLVQSKDYFNSQNQWTYVDEKPNTEVIADLVFAEKVVAYLKSNAIAIVYKGQTIGLGMGQVNRVDAVTQAIQRMLNFIQEEQLSGRDVQINEFVLASDAFFPFADSIEIIQKQGIKWILQPGGSVKDLEVLAAAKKYNINMVLTHTRHFKH